MEYWMLTVIAAVCGAILCYLFILRDDSTKQLQKAILEIKKDTVMDNKNIREAMEKLEKFNFQEFAKLRKEIDQRDLILRETIMDVNERVSNLSPYHRVLVQTPKKKVRKQKEVNQ